MQVQNWLFEVNNKWIIIIFNIWYLLGVPIISTNFPLIQNVDLQENIIFTCDGTPISTNVNVTWYKNAVRLLNQSNRIQLIENKLIIHSIEWDDQGMYQCFLTNDVGEDTRSTWLKIKSNIFIIFQLKKFEFWFRWSPNSIC